MKKFLSATLILATAFAVSAQDERFGLLVRVHCAKSGTLYLLVVDEFNYGDPKKAAASEILPVTGKAEGPAAEITFPDLPTGTYGVRAFLDQNGNGNLDIGAFGIPREPWGMSWKEKRPSMRPPRFSDYAFELKESRDLLVVLE